MAEWWTIEVLDGELPAGAWRLGYGAVLVQVAVEHGVVDWQWRSTGSGVVLELLFGDDSVVVRRGWEAFREVPAVRAALDAVPDPVNGLLMYPGLGGTSGSRVPRRPRPRAGADALALPEPPPEPPLNLVSDLTPAQPTGHQTLPPYPAELTRAG
jgi:hypothetical protein